MQKNVEWTRRKGGKEGKGESLQEVRSLVNMIQKHGIKSLK